MTLQQHAIDLLKALVLLLGSEQGLLDLTTEDKELIVEALDGHALKS